MTTALARSRAYLAGQRRQIIGRALVASLAGALPIPVLDDWAVGALLGRGYRKIAAAHQIDLDDDAVRTLVFGAARPPSIADVAASGIALRIASRERGTGVIVRVPVDVAVGSAT